MARRKRAATPARDPFEPLAGDVAATVDLHGLRAADARTVVAAFLKNEQKRSPGALLHIITGKGRGSERGPVLRRTVAMMLREDTGVLIAAWGSDLDGGGYLVRLKRR